MKFFSGLRGRRLAIATVAIFAAAAGIAYAAIPDAGTGTYHACMFKSLGTIRIIDPERQHCNATYETEITFNQKGPKGDPGLPGANGVNGVDGASPTVAQLAAGDPNCPAGGVAITDARGTTAYACSGQNGHDGESFTGTFTSPNGAYSLSVADGGITLAGGGDTISIVGNSVLVRSSGAALVEAGSNLNLRGGTNVTVHGFGTATVEGDGSLSLEGAHVGLNGGASCQPAARLGDQVSVDVSGIGSILAGSQTVCVG